MADGKEGGGGLLDLGFLGMLQDEEPNPLLPLLLSFMMDSVKDPPDDGRTEMNMVRIGGAKKDTMIF